MKASIIVPAYNEEKRSERFIPKLLNYVEDNLKDTEVIIVNDGSKDKTTQVIEALIKSKGAGFARVIGYEVNMGKGNAVAYGVEHASGKKILFMDADGSTQPDMIPLMLAKLEDYDVVVGDRNSARSKVEGRPLRALASFAFNMLCSILFQYSFRDNLCGFKGFKKHIAKELFKGLIDKRWVFDVELFYKIKKRGYSLYFLPITWKHVDGSKINLWKDPIIWVFRLLSLRIKLINWK